MVQRLSPAVFVGRRPELEQVETLRRSACAGTGSTVLVSGEAGIGKSSFCAEVARRAASDGWQVLSGTCNEFGTSRPLSVLTEMAPALVDAVTALAPELHNDPGLKAVKALSGLSAPTSLPGSVSQLILNLFRRLASEQPLLVILDDLQWADESSLELFTALARGLRSARALVVVAYRGDELERGHPLRRALAAVERSASPVRIEVGALSAAEAESLANRLGRALGDAAVAELLRRAGGNTFFLEQLLLDAEGIVPRGARDLILARFDALSADAQALAEVLSLEPSFPGEVLGAAAQMQASQFAHATDELAQRGFLVERSRELQLRHALLRDVVSAQVGPGSRDLLHRRIARSFEDEAPEFPGLAARHWYLAKDWSRALGSCVQAARKAFDQGAMFESADQFERANELWERVPDLHEVTGLTRREFVVMATHSFDAAMRHNDSIRLFRELLDGSTPISSSEWALAAIGLATALWMAYGNERANQAESARWFQRAIEMLDDSVPARDQVRVLSAFARTRAQMWGRLGEADAALSRARILTAEDPFGEPVPDFTVASATVLAARGDSGAVEMLQMALRGLPVASSMASQLHLVRILGELGMDSECIEYGQPLAGQIVQMGLGPSTGFLHLHLLTRARVRLGRWPEALSSLQRHREQFGEDRLDYYCDLLWDAWGSVYGRTGRIKELRAWLDRSKDWWVPVVRDETADWLMGSWALCHVELARADNDPVGAKESVDEVIGLVRGHHAGRCGEPVAYALGLAADSCAAASDARADWSATASRWIRRLRACMDEAPGRARMFDLGLFIEQALAEQRRLEGKDDPRQWEDLASAWDGSGRQYDEAYCRYRAAFAHLGRSAAPLRKETRERATDNLRRARSICRELGAIQLEADVEQLCRSAGLRLSRAAPAAGSRVTANAGPVHGLTSREVEVLRLLLAGDSNGQIAIRLDISTKTASVHVSNILRKLDASNRVEAAVWASRHGFVEFAQP